MSAAASPAVDYRSRGRLPPLPPDEMHEVILLAKSGDGAALEEILRRNMGFVLQTARKWSNRSSSDMDDLVHEGVLGLRHAFDKFDPDAGVKFLTYAAYWINQFIHRKTQRDRSVVSGHFSLMARTDYVPDLMIRLQRRGMTYEQALAEVAARCHSSPARLRRQLVDAARVQNRSLDAPLVEGSEDRGTLGDLLYEGMSLEMEDAIDHRQRTEGVRRCLDRLRLKPVEKLIVEHRVMPEDGDPKTLAEVGKMAGQILGLDHDMSRERIRQIEVLLLSKIKGAILSDKKMARMLRDDSASPRRARLKGG